AERLVGELPIAPRTDPVDPAAHRRGSPRARRRRQEEGRGAVPGLRRRLPRDARGDRHSRQGAICLCGRRVAHARAVAECHTALGASGRRSGARDAPCRRMKTIELLVLSCFIAAPAGATEAASALARGDYKAALQAADVSLEKNPTDFF